jgi:Uma2 family endonuclease
MAVDEHLHRFTTEEYLAMARSGLLADVHVELLDGLIVDVMTESPGHADLVRVVNIWFSPRVELTAIGLPLPAVEGWVPEPDIALNDRPARGEYATTAYLAVEIAVSSHARDRRKAQAYAAAGVPRYWIVDVPGRQVLEHLEPGAEGYDVVRVLRGDDVLDPDVEGIPPRTVDGLFEA